MHAAKPKDRPSFLARAERRFDVTHDTDTKLWTLLFAWVGMPVVRDPVPDPKDKPVDSGTVKLLEKIDEALDTYRGVVPDHERALVCLLKRWAPDLPHIEKGDDLTWFVKAFRQTDVTSDGYTDMAIWHLLNGSSLVWGVIERHFTSATTEGGV